MARNKSSSASDSWALPALKNWRDAGERGQLLSTVNERLRLGEISPSKAREFRLAIRALADEAKSVAQHERASRAREAAQRGHAAATKRLAEGGHDA